MSNLSKICVCILLMSTCGFARIGFSQVENADSVIGKDHIVIIAHKNVPNDSLSARQVRELYWLKKTTWSDGSLVHLFDLKKNSDAKNEFYDFIYTSTVELHQVWMRAVLSGEVQSPRIIKSLTEMVSQVGMKEGAIGYTLASAVTDEVKIIAAIR